MEKKNDMVNNPSHYAGGTSIECIDSMMAVLGIDGVINFCIGNAYKYIWRHKLKGNPEEDLEKAKWYISRAYLLVESYVEPEDDNNDSLKYYEKIEALWVLHGTYSCLNSAQKALHKVTDDATDKTINQKSYSSYYDRAKAKRHKEVNDEFEKLGDTLEKLWNDYDKDFRITPDEVTEIMDRLEKIVDKIDNGNLDPDTAGIILHNVAGISRIFDDVTKR